MFVLFLHILCVCIMCAAGSSPYSDCELHMCDTLCLFIESSN